MKNLQKSIGYSIVALGLLSAVGSNTLYAAEIPGVEKNTEAFLNVLAQGGGKPLEHLSPKDARAVLTGAQAGAALPAADVSEKWIVADGQKLKLVIVRPAGSKGTLPAFMFFHGGGWMREFRTV